MVHENFETMRAAVATAENEGVDLAVFPEMCLPGYFLGDEWEREGFLRDSEEAGRALAAISTDVTLLFGNVGVDWHSRGEDGRVRKYNASFCAQKGQLLKNEKVGLPFWPKTLLPNYREFDDSRHFFDLRKLAQERGCSIADLLTPVCITDRQNLAWQLGVGICEDAWTEDYGFSVLDSLGTLASVDFYVTINCSPYTYGKLGKRARTFGALAARVQKHLFHVNAVGVQNIGKTVFGIDGSSGLIGPDGTTRHTGLFFTPDTLTFDVTRECGGTPVVTPLSQDHPHPSTTDRTEELCAALEGTVRMQLEEWNVSRVVIGASGGIDSALSATLFARILGPQNCFLVNMPSKFNSALTQDAARRLAENLGTPYAVVPIEEAVAHTRSQLTNCQFERSTVSLNLGQFVFENVQARDRGGRILAAIAASLGTVFSCNANKAESTVGYSTLYGDLAGFLAPLADLWKRDVYQIAAHYNRRIFGREVIPVETLEVKPSAELSPEQDVTQGKGDPIVYEYHDYLFRSWVETWQRRAPIDILEAYASNQLETMIGCNKGLVAKLFPDARSFISDLERWWNHYQGMGAVKRVQAPPVVALTQRAFGFDHRESLHPPIYGRRYHQLKHRLLTNS